VTPWPAVSNQRRNTQSNVNYLAEPIEVTALTEIPRSGSLPGENGSGGSNADGLQGSTGH